MDEGFDIILSVDALVLLAKILYKALLTKLLSLSLGVMFFLSAPINKQEISQHVNTMFISKVCS